MRQSFEDYLLGGGLDVTPEYKHIIDDGVVDFEREIEIAKQFLEKEKNGTLDLNNLTEDEQQMRMFSELYDKSGLGEAFANAVLGVVGDDQLEDYKFFAPDMKDGDELLKAATQMLKEKGEELREC